MKQYRIKNTDIQVNAFSLKDAHEQFRKLSVDATDDCIEVTYDSHTENELKRSKT